MRFANIRELRLETNKVLALTNKNGPVVLTKRGKPIAMLRKINEDDLIISSLWKRIRQAAERTGYGLNDVEKLIKTSRVSKK